MKVILGRFQSDVLLSVSINMTPSSGAFLRNMVRFVDGEIAEYHGNILKFTGPMSAS